MGKDEVRGFYAAIFAAFDSPQLEFHEVLWDGATCTIRFTMTGRHKGEFMGVPATGADIALPGITILHFAGARVVERCSRADMLGLRCRSRRSRLPRPERGAQRSGWLCRV